MLQDNTADKLLGQKKGGSQITDKNSSSQYKNPQVGNQSLFSQDKKINDKKKSKKRKRQSQAQFTTVLKFFNMMIGLAIVGFGILCYYYFNTQTQDLDYLGLILPGYIAVSGFLILMIECNIGFIIRNMRFLYNYFGRGLFNIYVGVMPMALIDNRQGSKQSQTFQIIIYVMVSLMCLIGVLYILAKIFCCAKQGDKRRKKRKSYSSDSEQSDSD